jgi:hypothetical protein
MDMPMTSSPPEPGRTPDPLLQSARREALIVAVLFVVSLAYTVTYCTLFGYNRPAESLTFILGIPDWVFYGILCPWAVCTAIGCYFSYFLMRDHELEDEVSESDAQLAGREGGGG